MNTYEIDRRKKLENIRSAGFNGYESSADFVYPTSEIKDVFLSILIGHPERKTGYQDGPTMQTAGRVVLFRSFGKLAFATIRDQSGDVQVAVSQKLVNTKEWVIVENIDLGDQIVVSGKIGSTKTGECTVWASSVEMSCKSLIQPPAKVDGLVDIEKRYRQRYIDLWANPEVQNVLRFRSAFVQALRQALWEEDYIEVETPMLHPIAGGAKAKPFKTHHEALDMPLYLRIAPELYLKKLLVGGLKCIFEINRNFRNEGTSTKHNPEFTALELYAAYADYETMMSLVCDIIVSAAEVVSHNFDVDKRFMSTSDESLRWRTVKLVDIVKEVTGWEYDGRSIQEAPNILAILDKMAEIIKNTYVDGKFLPLIPEDQLVAVYEACCEPKLIDPTFVTHFPAKHVPLAKAENGWAEMFELVINGQEIGCGYSEQTDPDQQLKVFEDQGGEIDHDFIQALKVGMPPAGGLGVGIDRLIMVLTGEKSIRDVIAFPLCKSE